MEVTKFAKYADFEQVVSFSDASKPITGYLTFMTCDDERCLPPTDIDFSFRPVPGQSNDRAETGNEVQSETQTQPEQKVAESTKEQLPVNDPKVKKEKVEDAALQNTEEISFEVSSDFDVVLDEDAPKSGILDPVKWSYDLKKVSDEEYDLIFKAKIQDGWQLYSQFVEEGGPIPTQFYLDSTDTYKVIGDISEEGSKKEVSYDAIFEMKLTKFKKDAIFTQRIQVTGPKQIILGELEFMSCDDERCVGPIYKEFSFDLGNMKGVAGKFASADGQETVIPIPGEARIVDNSVASLQATYEDPIGDCGDEESARGKGLLTTFLLGFVGGFLALLTPCVFPMIPLTVSFFTKDTKRKGWVNGALYGLSIIVIYVALGIFLTLAFGPDVLNRLSTSWIANTIFFLIFMFFAFSFFGFYEITLPSSLANKSDSMADKGGLIGMFFMAFTLAVVSFSCTGPIIGSALVTAASKGILGPSVVMFGFALALAIPFGLFAAFPAWLNTLPKSGGWMNSVKVMLGFLEVALAFKFLSVADLTSHWGILKYELFMGIWVVVAIGMALYMFGIIKFPHDSPVKKLNVTRWTLGLGMAAIAVYLASGFMMNPKTNTYDSPKAMSGLAPPAQYNFFLKPHEADVTIQSRYPSFTKCANDLDCFKDYFEGVSYAKEVGKPILIDFTGHACVNCRKMEEHVWISDDVWDKINDDYVLISLYVDDKKQLEEETFSASENKRMRNVGNLWTDFQVTNFQQNSQPLYVLITPEEEVLAKPKGYEPDVKSYNAFLECGLMTFEKHQSKLLGSKE
jgi:thiol:disulfide interchange protein DsbD